MASFELNIDEKTMRKVQRAVRDAAVDAVRTKDVNYAGAQIMSIIQLRSARGAYLTKATGGTARRRRYKSESHKKKRAKLGLPTDRVTLYMGRVGVLEAMRVRAKSRGENITLDVGYIDGLSESRAKEIASYLTEEGAGINKVLYRFVGLTTGEESRIVRALSKRIAGNITESFKS